MKNISISRFIDFLMQNVDLPGSNSHTRLAPTLKGNQFRNFKPREDAKQSSVMILLKESVDDKINIVLTVRSHKLRNHSGQISFPGGRIEEGETKLEAAFRETWEEIGIEQSQIEFITALSPLYVPPSNNTIYPFVGKLKSDDYKINPSEVEEVFDVPIDFLIDKSNILFEERLVENMMITIPCWDLNKSEKLWGATAMILSELLYLYEMATSS